MRITLQLLTLESDMKTNRYAFREVNTALDTVREKLEREFDLLLERHPRVFRLALNEAEALAWETEFPHLVFPALALEKVHDVAKWHRHQKYVRRSEPILALAA